MPVGVPVNQAASGLKESRLGSLTSCLSLRSHSRPRRRILAQVSADAASLPILPTRDHVFLEGERIIGAGLHHYPNPADSGRSRNLHAREVFQTASRRATHQRMIYDVLVAVSMRQEHRSREAFGLFLNRSDERLKSQAVGIVRFFEFRVTMEADDHRRGVRG